MRDCAIFLNGVFENLLQQILRIQGRLPEHVMYLQPYSGSRIVLLDEHPPSTADPVQLFLSTTEKLSEVAYTCEIVRWEDKRELKEYRIAQLNRTLSEFQPTEEGIYGLGEPGKPDMVNLLHVRRMKKLATPFSVSELRNIKDQQPLSTNRSRAGGWTYIVPPDVEWLEKHL